MGKTSASIKLIQILSSKNDYISTDELAEILGINKRNIREYIKEIEDLPSPTWCIYVSDHGETP